MTMCRVPLTHTEKEVKAEEKEEERKKEKVSNYFISVIQKNITKMAVGSVVYPISVY